MKNYINYKISVLEDFGITNKIKLKKYLLSILTNCNPANYQTRIDNACRQIIDDYFNGDHTYCK